MQVLCGEFIPEYFLRRRGFKEVGGAEIWSVPADSCKFRTEEIMRTQNFYRALNF